MKALELHLKSGQTVTVDATTASTESRSGELTSLEWKTPEGFSRRLLYVDPGHVAAVVVVE